MGFSDSTIRTGLAAVLGLFAAVVLSAVAVAGVASRTSLFVASLDGEALFGLAVPVLAAELAESDVVARINTGPLTLTREDVLDILVTRFDPDDMVLKTREVHRDLIGYVRAYPEDRVFEISIRDERIALAREAERRVLERFLALPDCDLDTDLQILGRAGVRGVLGGASEGEFLGSLPPCRPPDPVADQVVEGIRAQFRTLRVEGPDSVEAFPDSPPSERDAYSHRIRRLQAVERWLGRWGWIPAAGVLLALGAVAGASRRSDRLPGGWLLLAALGAELLLVAGALSLDRAPPTLLALFGVESGGDPTRRLWLGLGEHGVRRVLGYVVELLVPFGLVLFAGGFAGRFARTRAGKGAGPPRRSGPV